jgi:hypothetical protein
MSDANTAKESEMITTTKIDELGSLLAQIKALTSKAAAIKDAIKDEASLSGQKVWEGESFEVQYVESNVSTVDWKALAKDLSIPAELIAKHTKTSARYTVNCEAK